MKLSITDFKHQIKKTLDISNSLLVSQVSLWRGTQVENEQPDDAIKPLELYDIENSAACRLVRETLTQLDLNVLIYPCPKGGERHRAKAVKLGGKEQFPLLQDPNTERVIYDAYEIIRYLEQQYGQKTEHSKFNHNLVKMGGASLSSLLRLKRGTHYRQAYAPKLPLELYSFESSPYARPVRELLCELELPYLLRNLGKIEWQDYIPPPVRDRLLSKHAFAGKKRQALAKSAGKVMVPYLIDPNTNQAFYESDRICAYLEEQYACPT